MADLSRRKLFGLMLGASAAAIGGSALLSSSAEAAPLQVGPETVGSVDPIMEKTQYYYWRRRRRRYWRRRRRVVRFYW